MSPALHMARLSQSCKTLDKLRGLKVATAQQLPYLPSGLSATANIGSMVVTMRAGFDGGDGFRDYSTGNRQ